MAEDLQPVSQQNPQTTRTTSVHDDEQIRPKKSSQLVRVRKFLLLGLACAVVIGVVFDPNGHLLKQPLQRTWAKIMGGYRVEERLQQFSSNVESRLRPQFTAAGVNYPPTEITYLVFKDERRLEVYARDSTADSWRYIKGYSILGLSGQLGPKLKEGDQQVPEGIYGIESLNPNSRFHVSLRLNYPNSFDRQKAMLDGRTKLGSDIMIHGGAASIGCLAIGDSAAEDLFTLAALVATDRVKVIISPTDFRKHSIGTREGQVDWIEELYDSLRNELADYRGVTSTEAVK